MPVLTPYTGALRLSVNGSLGLSSSASLGLNVATSSSSPVAGTDYSQVTASGDVNLSGSTLTLGADGSAPCAAGPVGTTYTLLRTTGGTNTAPAPGGPTGPTGEFNIEKIVWNPAWVPPDAKWALNGDRGVTMVLSTHDLNLAAALCRQLILLRGGRVIAQGPTADVLTPDTVRASASSRKPGTSRRATQP